MQLDSASYFTVETEVKANKHKFVLASLAYSLEIKYKKKSIVTLRAFIDFGFSTLAYQIVTISFYDNQKFESVTFSNVVKGTGFGIQLSKKFYWKDRTYENVRSAMSKL